MADDIAIRVKNLGKRYKLGQQTGGYKTLGETITRAVKSPFQRLQHLDSSEEKEEAGTFWALKGVSFEVKKGEVIGIIGRNGAGKSTLLKILSRITSPTEGTVEVHGRIGSLLEVGTGFHPELTGRDNIFLSGSIMGMKKAEIEEKFDEIVKFSEIEQFLDTPVKRYSSGMYVRLAFAVAAHLEPEILIIDEVLAVGDAAFQKKCLGKMGDVAKEGRTVLFVSHQMDMIRALCEKCILLNKGNAIAYRNSNEVIDQYLSLVKKDNTSLYFKIEEDKKINIQIVEGRIINDENVLQREFDVFEKINIEIKYVVRKPITGSIITLEVKKDDSPLFFSFDTDMEDYLLDKREIGKYISKIEIPCPLLKPGNYSVTLNAGIANSEIIHKLDDILSFEVELLSKPSTFKSYSGKRSGLIAVPLKWMTEKYSDEL